LPEIEIDPVTTIEEELKNKGIIIVTGKVQVTNYLMSFIIDFLFKSLYLSGRST
jgi:hypothetical protein